MECAKVPDDILRQQQLSMVTYLIIGTIVLWTGVNYMFNTYHVAYFEPEAYHICKTLLSLMLLVFALSMMRKAYLTSGILAMFIAMSSFTYSFSEILLNEPGVAVMDAIYSIPILVAAVVFLMLHRPLRGVASLILGLSMMVQWLSGSTGMGPVEGIGLLASGMLFLITALGRMRSDDIDREDQGRDRIYEMVIIPGFLMMSVYALINASVPYYEGYYIITLVLSFTMFTIAVMGILKGILLEGLMLFMYAFAGVVFSTTALLHMTGYNIIDLSAGCVIGVCGLMFIMRRQYALGIGAVLFAACVTPAFLFTEGNGWMAGSILLGICVSYYAVSRWVFAETGRSTLPMWE